MEDYKFIVGLTIEQAKEKLEPLGFTKFRVVERDGVGVRGTMDFRKDRMKLKISNDLIIAAYVG